MEKKLFSNYTRILVNNIEQVLAAAPHSSCTATYNPSQKLSKLDEPDMWGHWWRSTDYLISDVLLWTLSHGWAKGGRPARTYIQQLCADTGYSLEDLPEAMDDWDGLWERVRNIHADGVSWWWWYNIMIRYILVFIQGGMIKVSP